MHRSIVLFDFDGTLADTFETGASLINEFAGKFGYKTIDFANSRNLSARELVKLSGVKWWQIPRLVRFFRKESAKNANKIKPCKGVPEFLQSIAQSADLGILTTNSTATVECFLRNNNLDGYFGYLKTGVPLFGKRRALSRSVRALRKMYSFVLYVGDEIRDIEACRKAGVDIISVSWGFNSHQVLAKANPFVAEYANTLATMIAERVKPYLALK